MSTILITWVTKTGSTANTATTIGQELQAAGHQVSYQALDSLSASQIEGVDSVIIGAPVNGMAWHPSAVAFVQNNQALLKQKKVAAFLLSVAWGVGRANLKPRISACFDALKALVKPVDTACFGGYMETEAPFILRLIFGVPKGAPRDGRDPASISAWAQSLAKVL